METTNKKILIVEDEADLRDALEISLGHEGFIIITASDGEIGVAKALSEKPDLIILDIVMPKLDGIGVLKKLRADEWGKSVKIIVMTASDGMSKVAEVLEAGGDEYVVKTNVSLSDVVKKVKNKLGIH
jgi:DNA-binding response OmpR family regulator